jgi:hypothetical protein
MGGVDLSRDSAVGLQIHLAPQLHPQRLVLLAAKHVLTPGCLSMLKIT